MKKILVVDDNEEIVRILQESLSNHGYEVLAAYDGDEGLALAEDQIPDLIILDIMMPKVDGIKMSKKLKMQPATADIPIIFLTVLKEKTEDAELGRSPNIILAKPVSLPELLEAVESLI